MWLAAYPDDVRFIKVINATKSLTMWIYNGVTSDRPLVNASGMAAAIGVIGYPDIAGYMALQNEYMAASGGYHAGGRMGAREP